MEADGMKTSQTKYRCRVAVWMLIVIVGLVLPDGVLANHRSSIDERTGISARDSVPNTRMSSRNTRTRSGSQPAASPSRVVATDQRGGNRLSERCLPGRTCDQSVSNSRSSARTPGRAVSTSQGSQRRGSARSVSVSSRARTPSRSRVPSRSSLSSRSRAVASASETPRTSVPPRNRANQRTAVAVRDRVASRASTSSRANVPNVPPKPIASSRDSVAVRASGSSRAGVSSRTRVPSRVPSRVSSRVPSRAPSRVPSRVPSRAGGSSRSAVSTRSNVRKSSPSGVAVRNSSSSSGTSSRSSSRASTRGTPRGSSRASSSSTGISSRTSSRGTSRTSSRGSSVGVNRATSRSKPGTISTRGSTRQRTGSSRVQQTRTPSTTNRVKAVPNSQLRTRSNSRGRSSNRGTGSAVNNALPPSVNRFLNELKSSMPGSVGLGVGMSMANGQSSSSNTVPSSRGRSISSSSRPAGGRGIAVNQRQTGSSSRRTTSNQRSGSLGSPSAVVVDRVQPIIRPTFQDNGIGIDNHQLLVQDNLHADPFIANDFFIDPHGSVLSGDGQPIFVNNPAESPIAINDGFPQNSVDIPVSSTNQGIIQNLDEFLPNQQNQFVQDIIVPQTQIQSQTQHDPIIRGTSQIVGGQIIGVDDQAILDRTARVVLNDHIQPNDQRIVMDIHGIQTQTRAVDPIVGIRHNVVNTGRGQTSRQTQSQSVAVDPIIPSHQFVQGNTVGNVFGRVSVQSQGHSPVQQVQQPTEPPQHQHQLNHIPAQGVPIQDSRHIVGVNDQAVAGTQGQLPIHQPTFVHSNTQGIIQPLIGSNTLQVPQQNSIALASLPSVALPDTAVNQQPTSQSNILMTSNSQGGVGHSAITRGGIAIQSAAINSPIQQNGQVQQNIGVHSQHQQTVVASQGQFADPAQTGHSNHNQFSNSINNMQQSFPIHDAAVHDHGPIQGQGQIVQDQTAFATSGAIGQFVTPQPLDQSHLKVNRLQHNTIQTSGVIHPVINSQLTGNQGQGAIINQHGGVQIQHPVAQTVHQDVNTLGGLINVQAHQSGATQPLHQAVNHVSQPLAAGGQNVINQPSLQTVNQPLTADSQNAINQPLLQTINQPLTASGQNANNQPLLQTVNQPLTAGGQNAINQPLLQTVNQPLTPGGQNVINQHLLQTVNQPLTAGGQNAINQHLLQTANQQPVNTNTHSQPISAIGGQVLNNIQHAQTINQINDILNSQHTNANAANPSSIGSVGTIGGQTFQGVAPAASPVHNPLLNHVTPSPNGVFGSITTANPKRMLIQIDPNSRGVKIVPDGMGGVRVISLREAVTVSPFGNGNETGLAALLESAGTQHQKDPMSVPLGSSIISQSVLLKTLNENNKTAVVTKRQTTKRPFAWEAEATEKEIRFTGVTDVPEELEINGTSPDGTPPNAGLDAGAIPTTEPTSAALLRVTEAAGFVNSAEITATTQKTPPSNLPVTNMIITAHMLTTEKQKSQDDDEDSNSNFYNTVNIIDPFYGGMRRELVRNTNIIQELINKLAVIEYKKNRQAIDKATKEKQGSDVLMTSVLNELVKLENARIKEMTTVQNILNKRSTTSTTRSAGFTQRATTTPSPVVTTDPTVQYGHHLTHNNDTASTVNHSRKPLSIEDIHRFLHTFPNSNDILKRLADIFANNKTSPAPVISYVTQTPRPITHPGHGVSNVMSSSTTKTTTRRTPQTRGVTKSTTTVVTTDSTVSKATSDNGLPARMIMTSVNGDISFGDESAHRLNKLRQPVHVYKGTARPRHTSKSVRNEMLKTTRKTNPTTTSTPRNVIATDPYAAVFSLKNGNRHSHVAVYGTENNRNSHHIRGHNALDYPTPRRTGNKVGTTVRFRHRMTTSETTQKGIYMVTDSPGGPAKIPSTSAISMTMGMPTPTNLPLDSYRDGPLPTGSVSGMPSYMPLFGQDMMKSFDIKPSAKESINKRIEPNLNNIFSKAMQIQSPNGMQIKQLPRTKRTSSGLNTIA